MVDEEGEVSVADMVDVGIGTGRIRVVVGTPVEASKRMCLSLSLSLRSTVITGLPRPSRPTYPNHSSTTRIHRILLSLPNSPPLARKARHLRPCLCRRLCPVSPSTQQGTTCSASLSTT